MWKRVRDSTCTMSLICLVSVVIKHSHLFTDFIVFVLFSHFHIVTEHSVNIHQLSLVLLN